MPTGPAAMKGRLSSHNLGNSTHTANDQRKGLQDFLQIVVMAPTSRQEHERKRCEEHAIGVDANPHRQKGGQARPELPRVEQLAERSNGFRAGLHVTSIATVSNELPFVATFLGNIGITLQFMWFFLGCIGVYERIGIMKGVSITSGALPLACFYE